MIGARVLVLLSSAWAAVACEHAVEVRRIEPPTGDVRGGESVVIEGQGFHAQMGVRFGRWPVATAVVQSPQRMALITPAGSAGGIDVVVIDETSGRAYVLRDGFRYAPAP